MIPVIAATFLVAASPTARPAPAPAPRPTAAQIAQVKALTEKLGECHRSNAAIGAATDAPVDEIVEGTIAACEAKTVPIRRAMARVIGAERANAALAARRPVWAEAIRRIVAAERARKR